MNEDNLKSEKIRIAEQIRQACIRAAREGFRDASMSGLCNDGAIEAAVSAIQTLDIRNVLKESKQTPS